MCMHIILFMSLFSDRLRHTRSERGLTMRALGLKAGLGPATVRSLETDPTCNPRLTTLVRLAGALDVDLAWLATGREATSTPVAARPLNIEDLYLPAACDFIDAVDFLDVVDAAERDDLPAPAVERLWLDLGEAGA